LQAEKHYDPAFAELLQQLWGTASTFLLGATCHLRERCDWLEASSSESNARCLAVEKELQRASGRLVEAMEEILALKMSLEALQGSKGRGGGDDDEPGGYCWTDVDLPGRMPAFEPFFVLITSRYHV
jgi:hypothetical protein